jgi:hypothetical protein
VRSLHLSTCGLLALAAACAPAAAPDPVAPAPPRVDTLVMVDTVRVETESAVNSELEDRVALLQIQLLERDVQIQDLQSQLDQTRLELVRNMARLQTQATRAEAASAMSEADIALATLRRAGGESLAEYQRAQELFAQGSQEFSSENYGGALYLATEVRTAVRTGQARLAGSDSLLAGEELFVVPVPLKTTGRSNVRSGPGLTFGVVFTAEADAPLTGQSHTSQWFRIVDAEGREGWIFHDLVTSR